MEKTIFLNNGVEVLIVSFGGVGTTFLIEEIARYKKTNAASNTDGYKHLPLPPLSRNRKIKVIYLFGDPILACISLFRRSYQHAASVQMQKFLPGDYVIPRELDLEAYGKLQRDGLFFERHFTHWHTTYGFYPRMFVRYESLFDHLETIAEFLELPKGFVLNFPAKKERRSSLELVSAQTQDSLSLLYGDLAIRLKAMPDVFKLPAAPKPIGLYFSNPYRRAIIDAFWRRSPLFRHTINKIKMESNRLSGRIRTVLARVKRRLLKKPFLRDDRFPPYWINRVLGDQAAFLVQIGSNDGKTGDPFYPLLKKNRQWRALLVEPIPYFFKKLRENYPDTNRFQFENAAINAGESLPFYWLDPKVNEAIPNLPYWYEQLGSFSRDHIVSQVKPQVKPYIRMEMVEGISLAELLERHQIKQIDMLHIDAEGYDWEILSQLDLERFRPVFILYENHHLSEEVQLKAADFLREHYYHFKVGIDAFAVRKDVEPHLLEGMSIKLLK